MTKVIDRLRSNNYPTYVLQRAHQIATRPRRAGYTRDHPEGVLVLPYTSNATTHQVRKAVKRSGLNIRVAHKSGPQLRSILTRSALETHPCPGRTNCLACNAGLQGKCEMKNVVYRLECSLCSKKYIGETKRPVRERLMEHRRGAKSRDSLNPWGAHFSKAHSSTPVPVIPFKAEIISRTKDHVDRKLTEAIHIAEDSPELNTDHGWQLLQTVRGRTHPDTSMACSIH